MPAALGDTLYAQFACIGKGCCMLFEIFRPPAIFKLYATRTHHAAGAAGAGPSGAAAQVAGEVHACSMRDA